MQLVTLDWIVIAGYFALLLGVAWWVIRQNNRVALLGDAGRTDAVAADLARFRIRVDIEE